MLPYSPTFGTWSVALTPNPNPAMGQHHAQVVVHSELICIVVLESKT
jgi:hypothetical protein